MVDLSPALGHDVLTFCGKGIAATRKGGGNGLVDVGLGNGTQQLAAYQQQEVAFSHRQQFDLCLFQLHGRNDGMVIRYVLVGYQGGHIRKEIGNAIEGRHLRSQMDDHRCALRHIGGQIPAVGTGIGQQLLFIKGLCIVQSLLGRIAKDPVSFPLQGGQVIELRGILLLLLLGHSGTNYRAFGTGHKRRLRLGKIPEPLGQHFHAVQIQLHMMEFLLFEHGDLAVTLHQHGQSRCLDTAHIQSAVVQNGEQPGGIDAYQPVRFLAAHGAVVQGIVVAAGAQIPETFPDCAVLHRRDPQPFHRFAASGHVIHQPEDQLTFPAGITGIDDGIHVGTVHQGTKVLVGILLAGDKNIAERLREDGEIIIAPFFQTLVITSGVHRGHQMTHAPGNDQTVSLIIAIGPGYSTQGRSDRFCYTWFFSNNKFQIILLY